MFYRSVRIRDSEVQTPIYELRNPVTESQVSLVGAVHIASPEYYDQLTWELSSRELGGALIHFESVKKPSEAETAHSPELANTAEELSACLSLSHAAFADWLGATLQKDAIDIPPTWQNHDVSSVELVELLGSTHAQKLIKQFGDTPEILSRFEDTDPRRIANFLFRAMPIMSILGSLGIIGRKDREAILHHRNRVALRAARAELSHNPSRDLALFWGSAHLPGIIRGFKQSGYDLVDQSWLTAWSLKD